VIPAGGGKEFIYAIPESKSEKRVTGGGPPRNRLPPRGSFLIRKLALPTRCRTTGQSSSAFQTLRPRASISGAGASQITFVDNTLWPKQLNL
jgi:hypothetical protein